MILEPLQKLIAGLLLLIVVFLSGFYIGYKQEKEKYDAYKSQMVAMANLQQEATKKTLDGQQKITKETVNEYETKLANLRSYFSRMLNNNTCTCPLPTLPNTASEANAGASNTQLTRDCTATTLQLESLQRWVQYQYNLDRM
jgi:hypothetical protein